MVSNIAKTLKERVHCLSEEDAQVALLAIVHLIDTEGSHVVTLNSISILLDEVEETK